MSQIVQEHCPHGCLKHLSCVLCDKQSALDRAIAYLDAKEVASGRYAWIDTLNDLDSVEERWFVASSKTAALFGEDPRELYSYLRSEAIVMPDWWMPERRLRYSPSTLRRARRCQHELRIRKCH